MNDDWVNKRWYVYTMEYYLALKRKAIDTCYNMVEPWKYYAKLSEPDTKGQILYDAILRGTKNRQIHRDGK